MSRASRAGPALGTGVPDADVPVRHDLLDAVRDRRPIVCRERRMDGEQAETFVSSPRSAACTGFAAVDLVAEHRVLEHQLALDRSACAAPVEVAGTARSGASGAQRRWWRARAGPRLRYISARSAAVDLDGAGSGARATCSGEREPGEGGAGPLSRPASLRHLAGDGASLAPGYRPTGTPRTGPRSANLKSVFILLPLPCGCHATRAGEVSGRTNRDSASAQACVVTAGSRDI